MNAPRVMLSQNVRGQTMRHCIFIDPRHSAVTETQRRTLILTLGFAILVALLIADTQPAPRHQGFPEQGQSLSFMPETVRLRTQK